MPGQQEPSAIWPNVQWESVTSQYANLFFRVEGDRSEKFGLIQSESPELYDVESRMSQLDRLRKDMMRPGAWKNKVLTDSFNFDTPI